MRKHGKLAAAIAVALGGMICGQALAQIAPTTLDAPALAPPSQEEIPPLLNWALGLGAGHTDNINRSATDTTSQDILQPTLNFTFNQQGSALQVQAVGAVQYVDYLQGYFGNEFRGQLTGLLNWTISPQRLNFVAQDYSSVEPVSIRAADSPANQQQVNVFVAGPSLSFLLGAQSGWTGQADLRYINTTASKTKDFESQRGMGALRLLHDLSTTDHLSFNFETEGVHFDNTAATTTASQYTKYNLYARYASNLAKMDMDFSLGGSRIDFSGGSASHSGALANASISWRMDPRNTLQFAGSDQLTDATSDLAQAPSLAAAQLTSPTFAVGRAAISPAVFRNRNVSLNYTFQAGRFGFTLAPYYARLRQINGDDLSRNDYGAIVGASYLLSPLTTLGLTLGHRNGEYLVDHSTDRDNTAAVDLSQQLTLHWNWSIVLSHDQRRSTVAGNSYTENEIFAYLYYRR